MSFEAEFLTMMPSTMNVFPFIAFDTYGEPSYSTSGTSYRCYLEYTQNVTRDQLGEEVVSKVTAYIASTSALDELSLFILPDGSTGLVQSVSQNWDDEGIHHNVARFG